METTASLIGFDLNSVEYRIENAIANCLNKGILPVEVLVDTETYKECHKACTDWCNELAPKEPLMFVFGAIVATFLIKVEISEGSPQFCQAHGTEKLHPVEAIKILMPALKPGFNNDKRSIAFKTISHLLSAIC